MIRATAKYTIKDNEFDTVFTVFRPEYKEKVLIASLSTSRKCDNDYDSKLIENEIAREYNGNYYVNSNWNAVFMGKAFNKAKKYSVEEYTRITNVVCDITNEPYIDSSGNKIYRNPTLRISDFDLAETNTTKGMDTPPKVAQTEDEDDDDLPF